jgi:hypothetical protein
MEETQSRPRGRPRKADPPYLDENYFKDYYHRNKKNITCECGQVIVHTNKSRHLKTDRHTLFLTIQEQEKKMKEAGII